jgi:WD40 repeat protein
MNAVRLRMLRRRLAHPLPFLGWLRRGAVRELLADGSAAAVQTLLEVLPRLDTRELKEQLLAGLRALTAAEGRSAVCRQWARDGDAALGELLRAWAWVPPAPADLRVLCALKLARLDLLADAGEEEVLHLLAACAHADPEVAARAPPALRQLSNPAAREAVCRAAVEQDDRQALAAALDGAYLPDGGERRALFLFLAGRWEEYDALDFGRALLCSAYQRARPAVRRRVAEQVRRSGRADLLPVLTGGPALPRRGRLSEQEWQVTLDLLARPGQEERLWGLAQSAPPGCAARALRLLRARGWCPAGAEGRADFGALADLAEGLTEVECGRFSLWAEGKGGAGRPLTGDLRAVLRGHEGAVRGLAVGTDARLLASAGEDGKVCLWALPDGRLLHAFDAGSPGQCVLFGPDGEELVSAHRDGRAHVWPVAGGPASLSLALAPHEVHCLALSPDGALLACDFADGARVWGLGEGRVRAECQLAEWFRAYHLAVSPDGAVLACLNRHLQGGPGSRLTLWELPGGRLRANVPAPGHPASITFRRDGRALVTAGAADQKLRFWDTTNGRALGQVAGHRHWATWPDFEPDGAGRQAGVAGGGEVRLGRLPDGRLLAAGTPAPPVVPTAPSPPVVRLGPPGDGGQAADRPVRPLRVWVAGDSGPGETWGADSDDLTCLAAVPSQGLLAAAAQDGSVRLWALPFREEVLAQVPLADMTLAHWDWVRRRLRNETTPATERRGLLFLDALLRRRWRHEIHVEEARPALPLEHDIIIEG